MRIALAFFSFEPHVNGVVTIYRRVLDGLAARGHQLLLLVPPCSPPHDRAGTVVRCPGFEIPSAPGYFEPFAPPDLEARILAFAPDLVHVVDPWFLNPLGNVTLRIAKRHRIPRLVAYHTHHARYAHGHGPRVSIAFLESLDAELCGRSDLVIAPSRSSAEALRGLGLTSIRLWRGGIDTRLFHPGRRSESLRARLLGGDAARKLIVAVGRLAPEKNLGALCDLVRDRDDLVLAVAGEGRERPYLLARLPPDRGLLLGNLDPLRLAALYASADVHVIASTTEVQGLTVVESLACGTPVVAVHAGGLPEAIRRGVTGETVPPGDMRAFRAALDRWLAPSNATRAACAESVREWDAAHEVDDLLAHYQALLALPRARARASQRARLDPLARLTAAFADWAFARVPPSVHQAVWSRLLSRFPVT